MNIEPEYLVVVSYIDTEMAGKYNVKAREMFYEMYPDSDPKYWPSIDVHYRSDRGTVRIIKGKNDRDARWRKYLHTYKDLVSTSLESPTPPTIERSKIGESLGRRETLGRGETWGEEASSH